MRFVSRVVSFNQNKAMDYQSTSKIRDSLSTFQEILKASTRKKQLSCLSSSYKRTISSRKMRRKFHEFGGIPPVFHEKYWIF